MHRIQHIAVKRCHICLTFQQNSSDDVSRLRIAIRFGGKWLYDDWVCPRAVCWDTWTQQIASTAGDNRPVPQCLQLGPTVPPHHRGCMYAFFSVWWAALRWGNVALQYVDHEVGIFGFHQIISTKYLHSHFDLSNTLGPNDRTQLMTQTAAVLCVSC